MLLWQASELTCSRSRYVGARANLENYDLTIRIGNPVDTKIVRSLSRPDGNITGSSCFWAEVSSKRLELLKELMPTLSRVGVLVNPDNPAMESLLRAVTQTANAIGVAVQPPFAPSR